MAYYYKLEGPELDNCLIPLQGTDLLNFPLHKTNSCVKEPYMKYDFSKYILIEFLDDITPVKKLWDILGFSKNKCIIHKRITFDPHRLGCRRAIVICNSSEAAREIATSVKGREINHRQICSVVVADLIADINLFEKQIKKYGDLRSQQKLVYVSNLSTSRDPSDLVQFLYKKFSAFGTIISILVSSNNESGEAVIKFAFFSEAFAAEIALDEFVVGKERLHVTMQHNVVLCLCDLRVRLRDSIKHCQNKTADLCSRLSTGEQNANFRNDVLQSRCEKSNLNYCSAQGSEINSPIEDFETISFHNFAHFTTSDVSSSSQQNYNCDINECMLETSLGHESSSATEIYVACEEPTISCCNEQSALSDKQPDGSIIKETATSNQGFSSQIFGFVRNLFGMNSTIAADKSSCSNTSDTLNGFKQAVKESVNLRDNVEALGNENHGFSQNVNSVNATCDLTESPTVVLKEISNINLSLCTSQKMCHSEASGAHTRVLYKQLEKENGTENSPEKIMITYRNPRDVTSIKASNSSGNYDTTARADDDDDKLTLNNSAVFENIPSRVINDGNSIVEPIAVSKRKSSFIREEFQVLQHTLSPVKCTVAHSDTLINSLVMPSASVPSKSTCDTEQLKCSSQTLNAVKNISPYSVKDSLHGEQQHEQVAQSSTLQSQDIPSERTQYENSGNDSPIGNWLAHHLTVSTNNRVIATDDMPEGIVFATMTKDILIAAGCSHIACDSCYPSATDLIFGL